MAAPAGEGHEAEPGRPRRRPDHVGAGPRRGRRRRPRPPVGRRPPAPSAAARRSAWSTAIPLARKTSPRLPRATQPGLRPQRRPVQVLGGRRQQLALGAGAETYSPAAIGSAPASRPARPARRTTLGGGARPRPCPAPARSWTPARRWRRTPPPGTSRRRGRGPAEAIRARAPRGSARRRPSPRSCPGSRS